MADGPGAHSDWEEPLPNLWAEGRLNVEFVSALAGVRHVCLAQPFAIVGRGATCDVSVDDPQVATRALYLHATAEGVFVVDLNSDSRFAAGEWLRAGESYRLGESTLRAWLGPPGSDQPGAPEPVATAAELPSLLAPQEAELCPVVAVLLNGQEISRRRLHNPLTIIGRRRPSGLRICDGEVSGCHCALYWSGMKLWVVDLQSTNGTEVNGRPARATVVAGGGVIALGVVLLKLIGFIHRDKGSGRNPAAEASGAGNAANNASLPDPGPNAAGHSADHAHVLTDELTDEEPCDGDTAIGVTEGSEPPQKLAADDSAVRRLLPDLVPGEGTQRTSDDPSADAALQRSSDATPASPQNSAGTSALALETPFAGDMRQDLVRLKELEQQLEAERAEFQERQSQWENRLAQLQKEREVQQQVISDLHAQHDLALEQFQREAEVRRQQLEDEHQQQLERARVDADQVAQEVLKELEAEFAAEKNGLQQTHQIQQREVEQLQTQLAELQQELERNQAQLADTDAATRAVNQRHESRLAELQQLLKAQQGQTSRLDQQLAAERDRAGALQAELEAERGRTAELQGQLAAERAQAAALEAERGAERAQTAELQQQMAAECERAAALEAELEAERERTAELQGQLVAERAQAGEFQQQLAAEREQAATLAERLGIGQHQAAELAAQLERSRDDAAALQRERESDAELARLRLAQLGQELQEARQELAQLGQLSASLLAKDALSGGAEVAQLQSVLQETREQLHEESRFREALALQAAASEQQLGELNRQLREAREKLREQQELLQEQRALDQQELGQTRMTAQQATTTLAAREEQIVALQADLETLRQTFSELQKRQEVAGTRVAELEFLLAAAQDERDQIGRQLAAAQESEQHRLQKHHAATESAEAQQRQLQEELEDARRVLAQWEAERVETQRKFAEERSTLQAEAAQHAAELVAIRQRLEHQRAELERLQDARQEELTQLKAAQSSAGDHQTEIQQLRQQLDEQRRAFDERVSAAENEWFEQAAQLDREASEKLEAERTRWNVQLNQLKQHAQQLETQLQDARETLREERAQWRLKAEQMQVETREMLDSTREQISRSQASQEELLLELKASFAAERERFDQLQTRWEGEREQLVNDLRAAERLCQQLQAGHALAHQPAVAARQHQLAVADGSRAEDRGPAAAPLPDTSLPDPPRDQSVPEWYSTETPVLPAGEPPAAQGDANDYLEDAPEHAASMAADDAPESVSQTGDLEAPQTHLIAIDELYRSEWEHEHSVSHSPQHADRYLSDDSHPMSPVTHMPTMHSHQGRREEAQEVYARLVRQDRMRNRWAAVKLLVITLLIAGAAYGLYELFPHIFPYLSVIWED